MGDKHFTMWIKINCPSCISARDEFFRQRVNHTINIMDENLDELNELKEQSHGT